ncbi:MAG: 16S rRNA (cytidine(1402)-2'-O)-methyltransferase [Acidobacteria bacterium]|nr:16S rRNA (cytidine(1402)-2'-O)-methyltransferase [Acidobacteriota bacterium]MBI3663736.1 16S rRNA (cytidine(1402)-2'-O)-methyltransferase [Acidobacteriota bacterium]
MTRAKQLDAAGCLYLVATPIGNLEDITLRALRILKEADLIACEDTRQTQKLLTHYEMRKNLVSYHEHNEMTRAPELVIEMEQGAKVALVTDAGMPAISDPGHHLVSLCLRHKIPVVPVPGATALVAALSASGMPTEEFLFLGFLPSRATDRRKALKALAGENRTIVFYEAPHRLREMLSDALHTLGNRHAVVAREVTKLHEEFARGTLDELSQEFTRREPRGEITVLIGLPAENAAQVPAASVPLPQRVEEIMREKNLDLKAALKQAAREIGITKRAAYQRMLREKD